jgi:hypothetical protein
MWHNVCTKIYEDWCECLSNIEVLHQQFERL